MNILLTSVGRRTYIVEYFKKALKNKGKVYAANSEYTYALEKADGFVITPLIYNNNYIDTLLSICQKQQIDCIISLFDIDLYKLSQNKQVFEKHDIKVLVSNEDVISICNDKWQTYNFCKDNNFYTPKTYINFDDVLNDLNIGTISYPLVVKPRWGMGSIGLYIADSYDELKVFIRKVKNEIKNTYLKYESSFDIEHSVLIQECINGDEYNIDIINDFNGNYLLSSPKRKISMRAGETDIAQVVKNNDLENLGEHISKKLKHILNLDLDCIYFCGKYYVIDLNCRMGGGFPFSYLCGVNLPLQIVRWLEGQSTDFDLINVRQYKSLCKNIVPVILNDGV